jgi:hypothetical protein
MIERDRGIARANNAANPEWKAFMYDGIVVVAREKQFFTSDDVEELRILCGGPATHENRAFGALMLRARRNGVCRPTGSFEASRRRILHASPRRVWESLIYPGAVADGERR